MSAVDSGENDFEDMNRLKLDKEIKEAVVEVRVLARRIINRLEPLHIYGYPSLILILEECLEMAQREERLFRHRQKNKPPEDIPKQRIIGVIVDKGPQAKGLPKPVSPEYSNRPLLKDLFNAIGKPAPWELPSFDPADLLDMDKCPWPDEV